MSAQTPPAASAATAASDIGLVKGTWLVAEREISTALRTKAFIVSFIITALLVVLLIVGQRFIGDFFMSASGATDLSVATTVAPEQLAGTGVKIEPAASADAALEAVRSGAATAAWLTADEAAAAQLVGPDGSPVQVPPGVPGVLVGLDGANAALVQAFTSSPFTAQLEGGTGVNPVLSYFMAVAYGVLFMMSIMMYGQRIAQSVVEEKSSRIVELLLSTLRPSTIVGGKIIGGTILAVGQIVALVVIALLCFVLAGQTDFVGLFGPSFGWFAVLFLVGFVVFAALYAGLAATVSRAEDVATAVGPLTWLVMLPYMAVIMFSTNPQLMGVLSYIPFSAPVSMPIRIYQGNAEWWEPILSLVVLIASAAVAIWIGARIYQNSVLRTQGKVRLADAFRGA